MYKVERSPLADREIRKLPRHVADQINLAIDLLASDPRPRNCKKLKVSDEYRIRIGKYRVSYQVDDSDEKILITSAGPREHFYG